MSEPTGWSDAPDEILDASALVYAVLESPDWEWSEREAAIPMPVADVTRQYAQAQTYKPSYGGKA
jgi:hypothetical protein